MTLKKVHPVFVTLATLGIVGTILYLMGRSPLCECGYIKLWEGDNWSQGNSQHISDWYTFSHIIHGFIFFYLIRRFAPRFSFTSQILIALIIESAWEVLENSPMVIDRYRTTTASVDYYGDSILNALSDIVAMVVGYMVAMKSDWRIIFMAAIAMELITIYFIRDALIFNILLLIYPVQSIIDWQMEISP